MVGLKLMTDSLEIRESLPDDRALIEALYPDAFPDEDLLPLVRDLLREASITLSLVGMMNASLVGHIVFTRCGVAESSERVALLGPLAVPPSRQRQGIGSALVRTGLERQACAGVRQVFVLGDPVYYGRFGFMPEFDVAPPYSLPTEWRGAWRSINLAEAEPTCRGELAVPNPWQQPALWAS